MNQLCITGLCSFLIVVHKKVDSKANIAGMNTWLKVHRQSWMILFLLMHTLMFCICHRLFHVLRGPEDLKNLQMVHLYILLLILKIVLAVTLTISDMLNAFTIYKK